LAEELSLTFIKHSFFEDDLLTECSINGSISPDTTDAIRNGITATFDITFQLLYESRAGGKRLRDVRLREESFSIEYDVWENKYIVKDISRENDYLVGSTASVVFQINKIINPISFRIRNPHMEDKFTLRAKIKIKTIKLFPPFGIFLLFFDPWNYESRWISTDTFTMGEL
jgi:hypothetical protein